MTGTAASWITTVPWLRAPPLQLFICVRDLISRVTRRAATVLVLGPPGHLELLFVFVKAVTLLALAPNPYPPPLPRPCLRPPPITFNPQAACMHKCTLALAAALRRASFSFSSRARPCDVVPSHFRSVAQTEDRGTDHACSDARSTGTGIGMASCLVPVLLTRSAHSPAPEQHPLERKPHWAFFFFGHWALYKTIFMSKAHCKFFPMMFHRPTPTASGGRFS
jgi:hypothetical protein